MPTVLISLVALLTRLAVRARVVGGGPVCGPPPACRVRSDMCVLHLGAENIVTQLQGGGVRPVPGYVLLADDVELLFARRGATGTCAWQASPFTLEPRLVELSALMRLGARLRVH